MTLGLYKVSPKIDYAMNGLYLQTKGPNLLWGTAVGVAVYASLPEGIPFLTKLLSSSAVVLITHLKSNLLAEIGSRVCYAPKQRVADARVGALIGSVLGLGISACSAPVVIQNILSKDENKSPVSTAFQESAIPYFKELQEQLKVEKGLVLDIAPRANAPKLALA